MRRNATTSGRISFDRTLRCAVTVADMVSEGKDPATEWASGRSRGRPNTKVEAIDATTLKFCRNPPDIAGDGGLLRSFGKEQP
jgi:hypothetical protein